MELRDVHNLLASLKGDSQGGKTVMSQDPADSADTGSVNRSLCISVGIRVYRGASVGWKAGLNIGVTATSMIFLGLIALLVIFLTIAKKDALKAEPVHGGIETGETAAISVDDVAQPRVADNGAQ
ncbi:unnamed protein product [Phytophthora lilii]|uniref:Unnamed protein product n=1 Tax=Phytophthora lilii TaxID=2077276 RepID=A0A9W7CIY2_9STRA|nr:unnamed protein product [Phytophthora lilii]